MYVPRALEFIYVFLETFASGEQDLAVCARKAYGDTLKRYHGWMVQGIFSVSDGEGGMIHIIMSHNNMTIIHTMYLHL